MLYVNLDVFFVCDITFFLPKNQIPHNYSPPLPWYHKKKRYHENPIIFGPKFGLKWCYHARYFFLISFSDKKSSNTSKSSFKNLGLSDFFRNWENLDDILVAIWVFFFYLKNAYYTGLCCITWYIWGFWVKTTVFGSKWPFRWAGGKKSLYQVKMMTYFGLSIPPTISQ